MSEPVLIEIGKRYKFKIVPLHNIYFTSFYDGSTRINNLTNHEEYIIGTVVTFSPSIERIYLINVEYL